MVSTVVLDYNGSNYSFLKTIHKKVVFLANWSGNIDLSATGSCSLILTNKKNCFLISAIVLCCLIVMVLWMLCSNNFGLLLWWRSGWIFSLKCMISAKMRSIRRQKAKTTVQWCYSFHRLMFRFHCHVLLITFTMKFCSFLCERREILWKRQLLQKNSRELPRIRGSIFRYFNFLPPDLPNRKKSHSCDYQ